MAGNLYDEVQGEFPGVEFVDHIGGDGRLKAEFKPNAIPSSITSRNASGLGNSVTSNSQRTSKRPLLDSATPRRYG
jgi:hypothetical protein